MEFHNLTPFDALSYSAVNAHDEEHHVVAIKVAWRLTPKGGGGVTHGCEFLLDDDAAKLALADVFDGALNASSVRAESDIAPFKPRCDVLVRATAWAPGGRPATRWPVRLRVTAPDTPPAGSDDDAPRGVLIDKALEVCGPRWFERALTGWTLTASGPTDRVPVRWERAFGGRSTVADPRDPSKPLLDEVCFTNPLGRGWIEARHEEALRRSCVAMPERIDAPQVERPDARVTGVVIAQHPPHAVEAPQMAELSRDYAFKPAGLGCVGRAWTPRLQRAGTYDDAWLRDRHPFLPDDFSFSYWNAAPDDQQIAHPGLGLRVELMNLCESVRDDGGLMSFELPQHRAFVMAWMAGLPVPVPAVIDTLTVDAEAMVVTCVWRALLSRALGVTKLEARYETDPRAPLLKLEVAGG